MTYRELEGIIFDTMRDFHCVEHDNPCVGFYHCMGKEADKILEEFAPDANEATAVHDMAYNQEAIPEKVVNRAIRRLVYRLVRENA